MLNQPMMNHPYDFDPTGGYDEAALRAIAPPPPPADFESFWRSTHADAAAVPLNLEHRPMRIGRSRAIYEIEFDAWGGVRIGGWLTTPVDRPVTRALVVGHGYGSRDGPDATPLIDGAILYPCARGFGRSRSPGIPDESSRHVLHGIGSRETYVIRGCVTDLWAAARAVNEMFPDTAGRTGYAGESFGGGLGALAVPWEPRFSRCFLDNPTFGHQPVRLKTAGVGSGEAVRQAGGERHLPVLAYFDGATAATFTTTPTLVAAALFDPAVTPPGQFAIHNGLAGPKQLFVRQAAHFDWPGAADEGDRVRAAARAWFDRDS